MTIYHPSDLSFTCCSICISRGPDTATAPVDLLPTLMLPTLALPSPPHTPRPPEPSLSFVPSSSSSPPHHAHGWRQDRHRPLFAPQPQLLHPPPDLAPSLLMIPITEPTLHLTTTTTTTTIDVPSPCLSNTPCLLPTQRQPHRVGQRLRPLRQNPILIVLF